MKKILFLLLMSVSIYGQTYQNPTFGTVTTKTSPTVTNDPYLTTTGTTGVQGKIAPVNVLIPYTPINYTISGQTIGQQIAAIDAKIGTMGTTSAGLTQRVDFTADNTTVNSVVYFASSLSGKGSTSSGSPPALLLPDNTKAFFTKDVISIAQPSPTIGYAGVYSGNLTVSASPTPVATKQRFTVEIYRTDNLGNPIASGVSGAPVGDLGVTVLAILDSGELNLTAGSITNIPVSGRLTQNVTINMGERLRYHVSAAKIGTGGGNVTFGVYYGTSYNSYYDIPVAITTDAVLDRSDVSGAVTATDALNYLNTAINSIGDYSSLKPAVTITNDGLYNAFPGVEKASNGDLVTVYRKGVTHLTFDGSIRLKRSTDNGFTWGSESTIITGVSHDYRDPSLTRLANGNLIMSYFDRISPTNILIYTSVSTDNGNTFGTPVQLTGYADYGAVSSKVIQLANGNLLLATYGKSGANGLLNVFRSTNNGTSWTILSTISTDAFGSALKYTEPSLVLLSNGNVVATVRNDTSVMIARAVSTDSGATWSSVVDKFSGNSRAQMQISGSNMVTTYRGTDGNSYLRISTDEGVSFGNPVKLTSNEVGEQNEYSAMVEIKSKTIAYVYSNQNSAGTSAYIKLRYLNDPISLGDIPYFQTEGLNSTGSSSIAGSLYNNNILGLSGLDVNISTNTSNTTRDVVLKAGNVEVFKAKGTGYGQFISRVGFGTPTPNNIASAYIPSGTGGGFSLQNLNGSAEYARWGVVNPGTVNNSFIGSFTNNSFSIYSNGIERMVFHPSGGVSHGNAVDPGANNFSVVGNITAANLVSGTYTPTLTGVTNVSSVTLNSANYTRVGNIVTVFVSVAVNPTVGGSAITSFNISLPINRTLTTPTNFGAGSFYNGSSLIVPAFLQSQATNTTGCVFFPASVSGVTGNITFQYSILN